MSRIKLRTWLYYVLMLLLFCVGAYFLIQKGSDVEVNYHVTTQSVSTQVLTPETNLSNWQQFKVSVSHNIAEPITHLLLQIIAILLVSRLFGLFFSKINQPTVIAEILAGIVLGPSLLGHFFPNIFNFLFAADSLPNLYILSQIGLILFMFTIGMELNITALKEKASQVLVISHASILIPYFLGMTLAFFYFEEFAIGQTRFLPFALFIGISMSITAFPVLARIVQEKGLTKTHLGTIAIASAAIDDVTAWCLLALIIAISKTGDFVSALYTVALAVAYILFMFFVIRPFLKKIGEIYQNIETLNKSIVAFLFLILISSAFITQFIGIHALFGAFLAGVVMPPIPNFRKLVIEKVEDVSLTLLLPLFFVFTGLRTEIGLLNSPYLWGICGIFIATAIVGKFVGGAFSARFLGESWHDSLALGTLMNTRGLMELIVLNIGYEMHILPPSIFVMLVIMAIVTTFMTTPMLSLIEKVFPAKNVEEEYIRKQSMGIFKVLIAVGNPENGKMLLRVAKNVLDGVKNTLSVTVLHITPGTDTNPIYGDQFAEESFNKVKQEAEQLNIPIETEYKVVDSIENAIVRMANTNNFDFLLVGAGLSLSGIPFFKERAVFKNIGWLNRLINNISKRQVVFYPGTLIKDKTKYFIEQSNCSVGVFVNRGFSEVSSAAVLLYSQEDEFLLHYARRLLRNNSNASVTIFDLNKVVASSEKVAQYIEDLEKQFPASVKLYKQNKINSNSFSKFSLMFISYQTWNALLERDKSYLSNIPSTLIINKKNSRFHSDGRRRQGLPQTSEDNADE
jgi:Kef-type K+ transport system membrane component KefB/nucleotide-binding universal stress UspA family protein